MTGRPAFMDAHQSAWSTVDQDEPSFSWRFRRVVMKSSLDGVTKSVLQVIANHAKADGSDCFPSHATIARESGWSARAVRNALKKAKRAGFLDWRREKPRDSDARHHQYAHNYYMLKIPDVFSGTRCR